MGLYKLLPKTGKHVERDADGVEWEYGPGNTIESETDLVRRFPNKFVRIDAEPVPGGNVAQPTIPVPHRFVRDGDVVSSTDAKTGDSKATDAKATDAKKK